DYAAAAREFALADELLPNPTALRQGLKDAIEAGDAPLAMTLADRAEKRGGSEAELAKLVAAARAACGPRVGRLVLKCTGTCQAELDGKPTGVNLPIWVDAGEHAVTFRIEGRVEQATAHVSAGSDVAVSPPPPAASPAPTPVVAAAPAPARRDGLSPAWFVAAAGVTTAVAGATIASGVDTLSKHDAYERDTSQVALKQAGQSAQTRTNVLLAVTGAAAAGTAALGLFGVRWSSGGGDAGARGASALAVSLSPAAVAIGGAF
ncbi:MAG TPA: hypothetical protein VHB21_24440, partial [Minicystis sp.]|nr:hypothetical protein [Minicystis sp.]